MDTHLVSYVNNIILNQVKNLRYVVKDFAPQNENELFASTSLVIWSGASDNTIFHDASVNWAFRALHDKLHLETRFDFTPQAEIELGRIQASKYEGILADLVYCEVSLQAQYYLNNGGFVPDQTKFTMDFLKKEGHLC